MLPRASGCNNAASVATSQWVEIAEVNQAEIKFIYSKKASIFWDISTADLVVTTVEILENFVAYGVVGIVSNTISCR